MSKTKDVLEIEVIGELDNIEHVLREFRGGPNTIERAASALDDIQRFVSTAADAAEAIKLLEADEPTKKSVRPPPPGASL